MSNPVRENKKGGKKPIIIRGGTGDKYRPASVGEGLYRSRCEKRRMANASAIVIYMPA